VIIDQFIVAAEDKWSRLSGITLLLPHGFEGQGPEHSSARFERFLQMCAEDNIQVAQPSTPAQMFHLLRRQVKKPWRKPLIVMTPKSLLRLPAATSQLAELQSGTFQRVIDDAAIDPLKVSKLLLCTGRIYFDLVEERKKRHSDVAIVRIEELYPWHAERIGVLGTKWQKAGEVVWVQDEPGNMGAATFVVPRLEKALGRPVRCVTRESSASPATGSHHAHAIEQDRILHSAFGS
jgi:2-oxoglutarate dehydrogenase E1 component